MWRKAAAEGKLDLIVDLNFRMDTSALYSDVVLPAASWYEKDDLNSTDLHSFIHPLQAAVPPCWESRSDWQIFRELAWHTQELARRYPGAGRRPGLTPLLHDTPAEVAQPTVQDWAKGECEPVPGRPCRTSTVVGRDYANLYNRFVSLGPKFRDEGLGVHGTKYAVDDSTTHPRRSTRRGAGTAATTRRSARTAGSARRSCISRRNQRRVGLAGVRGRIAEDGT